MLESKLEPPGLDEWSALGILQAMTLEEKASLLAGVDDWNLPGVPRLGVRGMKVTDCGHGVTLVGDRDSAATCFPTGIGMASTWNEALLEEVGQVIGRETRALGCSILLGPKINIHRIPLNGRSFETFSEDPWLAGLLGGAEIRGIQSVGVGACVKAMSANNQQKDQQAVSSEVGERPLREIYYRAFEIAVTRGNPCAIMTSYNRLNGDYTGESRELITNVIKGDWQFPGFVVSDWRSIRTEKVFESGLDLEMPGPGVFYNRGAVLRAVEEGLLSEEDVNDKALRLLTALLEYGQDGMEHAALDTPEHRRTALRVAEESIVLLKNDQHLLPLDKSRIRKLLITGPNAADARLGGGGSASVTPFYSISPLEGLREICGDEVEVEYVEGCSMTGTMETMSACFQHLDGSGQPAVGLRTEYFNDSNPVGEPAAVVVTERLDYSWGWASPSPLVRRGALAARFCGNIVPPATGRYRLGVYAQEGCVRLQIGGETLVEEWTESEEENFEAAFKTRYQILEVDFTRGVPVPIILEYGKRAARAAIRLEWEVPGSTNPIMLAAEAASRADVVLVCAGLSNLMEGGAHDRETINLPAAQEELIRAVAKANPRTAVVLFNGGPLAVPWADDVPALLEAWYPGQEGGRALAKILFGEINPSGRLPDTIPHKLEDHASSKNYPGDGTTVHYEEGLFVGYRHFDAANIEPRFPFGFGLSYTSFEISTPELSASRISPDDEVEVTVNLRNTGPRSGKAVVQLYIRPLNPPVIRPDKELRAFQKIELEPGGQCMVRFQIDGGHLSHFDVENHGWRCAPGRYEILVGSHSRNVKGVTLQVNERPAGLFQA
ncbi:MAG: glycoside hydrolase family 3 C-terminal domain-containing protein [Terrimicrobiaceae bacterium]